MAGKLDKVPQPVREAIAVGLMVASVSATAAALLHEPLFILGGTVLFLIFYVWRISPKIREAYRVEEEKAQAKYADDDTYEPILARFESNGNDEALIEGYRVWSAGPHENDVRLRFLQEAIVRLIAEGKIYRVEELIAEAGRIAAQEGLDAQFETFRAECDRRIAAIAQKRLADADGDTAQGEQPSERD